MQIAVDGEKEIVDAAVEYDLQVSVMETVCDVEYGVIVPVPLMIGDRTQVFFDTPVVGEGAEIDSAAGGAGCAKKIFVPDGKIKSAVSAHAEAGDGAMVTIGTGS